MFTRRSTMALGLGAAAVTLVPLKASANIPTVEDAVADFTGGASVADEGVSVIAPEIAENGENVPVEIDAPGAVAIMVLAPGNPTPRVVDARFGEASGAPRLATRLRLGETQEVTAYAKMADGSYKRGKSEVRVTIGGCGG